MPRTIQPELLDSLPPDHPDALHNRRDLRAINRVMGNHRWLARVLPALVRTGERVLEVGAGTGELAARLERAGVAVDGLDLWPKPPTWPAHRIWHRADLRAFGGYHAYGVIVGNLIFHQFDDAELTALGGVLREHARLIVAVEPARSRVSQFFFRWLAPIFGANHVTMHDAHVSIDGGFLGRELPLALGLDSALWHVRTRTATPGGYRMIAVRHP